MTARPPHLATVELLCRPRSSLTPQEAEQAERATLADLDAADAALAAERAVLAVQRADVVSRLRALGLHDVAEAIPEP